jgi:hypothetical protein
MSPNDRKTVTDIEFHRVAGIDLRLAQSTGRRLPGNLPIRVLRRRSSVHRNKRIEATAFLPDASKFIEAVPVSRIFLGLSNPRHEPCDAEAKVIARLCEKEDVYPLARDIVKHGLSPLERFALVPLDKRKSGRQPASMCVEAS